MGEEEIKLAKRRGWAAYINDTPRVACPYYDDEPDLRNAWLDSWDESKNQPHGVLL